MGNRNRSSLSVQPSEVANMRLPDVWTQNCIFGRCENTVWTALVQIPGFQNPLARNQVYKRMILRLRINCICYNWLRQQSWETEIGPVCLYSRLKLLIRVCPTFEHRIVYSDGAKTPYGQHWSISLVFKPPWRGIKSISVWFWDCGSIVYVIIDWDNNHGKQK